MIPVYRIGRSMKRMAELEAISRSRSLTDAEVGEFLRCKENELERQRYHRKRGRAA